MNFWHALIAAQVAGFWIAFALLWIVVYPDDPE